ncbi:MAG: NPCBM/NEW2 domain-containing protein [Planctomycetota bacterium]
MRIDGQLRFAQEDIAPGKLHGPIRLDVTGAKRIKLTVLFGQNADLQDRFDWIEPALIR